MRLQNTIKVAILFSLLTMGASANGQNKAYQRKKSTPAAEPTAPVVAPGAVDQNAEKNAEKDSDKVDISELEQKYWAPKDTDFSVVQNRTYTKVKKMAVSIMGGPAVNDTFNEGFNVAATFNYYFDERYGMEAMFIGSDLKNSEATETFLSQLSGGQTAPDFNRPTTYYGVGFNWVPFYAKMSFLGKKIIYFDMQITPHIGMSGYEQIIESGNGASESAFSYGVDVTQYFFFQKSLAVRVKLHNRWYNEDVVGYEDNIQRRSGSAQITNFLIGLTYFF